jgi:hypothetical protein
MYTDSHRYPALAWNREGQPFHPAPQCAGWRVHRLAGRGRPSLVYGQDGPLHLDMDCDFEALRKCAGPGKYVLHQVDAGGSDIPETPVAHVTITELHQSEQARQEADYVALALRTQESTIAVLRDLLIHLVNGTANLQKATAELLGSGTDAMSIASGAGLPEHIAALLPEAQRSHGGGVEALLSSPVVASALTGLAQALKPAAPAAPGKQEDSQKGKA